jgi:hypothetical protein
MIDFRTRDWEDANKIFDFFRQETDCLDRQCNLVVNPGYVVAIDDDAVSAYYAAVIMKQAKRQFGKYPKLLCVGGIGMFSKYVNRLEDGTSVSEGAKLRMVASRFGNFPTSVLDRGSNTGANIKEIIDYIASDYGTEKPVIFCTTQRLSKRLERTVAYSAQQFPGTQPLNAYYYVPGEDIKEVCRFYNGRALADGLPLLSEAAALYDRVGTDRYANKYMAEFDKMIPKYIIQAGMRLTERYPLRVSRSILSAPRQYARIYFGLKRHRQDIADDLEQKIIEWMARV